VIHERADMPNLHLTTDRLELRPLALDDLDGMASMLGDGEALRPWGSRWTATARVAGSSATSRATRPTGSGGAR
jgi:hypothetical protein